MSPYAKEVLQWMSYRSDQKIILWTSSYKTETDSIANWLKSHGINIDYVNCNPEVTNTEYAEFADKPYFNVGLDDKFGMEPSDWKLIKQELIDIGEWN